MVLISKSYVNKALKCRKPQLRRRSQKDFLIEKWEMGVRWYLVRMTIESWYFTPILKKGKRIIVELKYLFKSALR